MVLEGSVRTIYLFAKETLYLRDNYLVVAYQLLEFPTVLFLESSISVPLALT
jgi:hypothetical protein